MPPIGSTSAATIATNEDDNSQRPPLPSTSSSPSSVSPTAAVSPLMARLSAPDGIMESDVLSTLASYLQSGGSPRTAIRLLSDNYCGHSDTINLLQHWLTLTDDEQPTGAQSEQQPSYATEAFQQLVIDSFDPTKADTVFATFDAMPEWLAELLSLEGWRAVMGRLHATYPQSLFVSFAVRAMRAAEEGADTSQAEESMADVRSRVEQQLGRLIADVQSSSADIHSQLASLATLASHSECAYLYIQSLLQSVGREAGLAALLAQRVSEDVSIYAGSLPSAASSHTVLDFILLHSPRHSEVSSALLPFYRALSRCTTTDLTLPLLSSSLPRLTTGDVNKLYAAYSSSSPPPIALLQYAPLLCTWVHTLFDSQCSAQEHQQIMFLLCAASSPRTDARWSPSSLHSALTSLVATLNSRSWLLSASSVLVQLRAAVHSPLLSSVALYFIHNQLTSSAYFDSPSAASFTPSLLSVVGELITACPLLHPAMFATLAASFSLPALSAILDSLALISYRKLLVLLMLHLLLSQHVSPVLSWAQQQLVSQDHSLVRAFVLGVMGGVAECGPDVAWLSGLVELLCVAEVRAALRQWAGELSEAIRSERWRRLMADKRLGKTDAGRKRLRRMGPADGDGDDDDPDWQPDDQTQTKSRRTMEVKAALEAEAVKVRSFTAHDTLLDADEAEVREDVRHFGRLIVGVHARLSMLRDKGKLDHRGDQLLSEIDKLFVVLQET